MHNLLAPAYLIETIIPKNAPLTLKVLLIIAGIALAMGIALSLLYIWSNRKDGYSKGMAYTLVMLPSILSILCVVSSDSLTSAASAISIGGALTIIRFRSTQGSPKDLAYIFTALTIGLSCGRGYPIIGGVLLAIMVVVMAVLSSINFGVSRNPKKMLKITIPETLNYVGVFDEILSKYTIRWDVSKVRSTNFGTMFELSYTVQFKPGANTKEMFDEIRCLNGNLNISLQNYVYEVEA